MKIAQVAPLYESVPPRLYGGTERIVSFLTEGLVEAGHEVTLYASADSVTSARLVGCCPSALRLDPDSRNPLPAHVVQLERVAAEASAYDVIHFHVDAIHFPIARRLPVPSVTTLHGRLDATDDQALFRVFADQPVVSISNDQRKPVPWMNWQATVHHGLPPDRFPYHPGPGQYLAFLGRISPEKRPDRAIEMARRFGMELRIAAKVDGADRAYYEETIAPLLREPGVRFVGEIGEREKAAFLGEAHALLFPIDWPEPFGLVMIEALATGTPVIAYPCGAVPEVIDDGVTGFVVRSLDEAVAALGRVSGLRRADCRRVFEERFSAPRMVRDYLDVYRRLPHGGTRTTLPCETASTN